MRFLLPLILIGAILGSQIAFAESANVGAIRTCSSRAQERRALRMIRAHRNPNCQPKSVQSSSSSPMSSSRSSQSSFSSSRSSSDVSVDPKTDTEIRSQFLLLGEVGPILGAASIFIEEEPLQVTSISINLTQEVPTVAALLVYDDERHFLGTAFLDPSTSTNRAYKVSLASDAFTVMKREQRTIYVRPRLSSRDAGGQSNQRIQISTVVVKGNGVWSSQAYTKTSSSSDRFPAFVSARSLIASAKRVGDLNAALTGGMQKQLAMFEFTGRKSDSNAHIDLTSLTFTIDQTGGVGLSNVSLLSDGFNEKFPCTASSTQVICSSIPDLYGSLSDLPRRLSLVGDITLSDSLHAGLRLTLNASGDPDSDGAISWSDGSATFTWVSLPEPVVEGTYFKY